MKALLSLLCLGSVTASFAAPGMVNDGARIECVARDSSGMASTDSKATAVVVRDDGSISCPLVEGATTFVLALPRNTALGRLTFVNGNTAARGQLRIAVANENLSADSPQWIPVDGTVPFAHARRFDVSMIGIDAKFVRVTFDVQRDDKASAALRSEHKDYAAVTEVPSTLQP